MKKNLFLSVAAVIAIAAGVVGMSAFEAHIINVTAQIENALSVMTDKIEFGTVFPQEQLDREVAVALSQSFLGEADADDVEYKIKQKPKCKLKNDIRGDLPEYGRVTENDQGVFVCADETNYEMLPLLCPYLSKHDMDPEDQNDESLAAFHGPLTGWTDDISERWAVAGRLAKSQNDESDLWNIDLKVPCFEGKCAQDWEKYVTDINPKVQDPMEYVQPTENESAEFGCDLWIEVTGVSRVEGGDNTASIALGTKTVNWEWIEQKGTLTYVLSGPTFDFSFTAQGMTANEDYDLIYYADGGTDGWRGDNPGAFIGTAQADSYGDIAMSGAPNLSLDLPDPADPNTGAKIWLVPSSMYNRTTHQLTGWDMSKFLFEYNTITYEDTDL